MLLRSILSYAPSNIVPPFAAVTIILVFTRLLPPDEFGRYAVAQAATLIAQALLFFGLQVGITRFYSACSAEAGGTERLLATSYCCYAVLALVATGFAAVAIPALVSDARLAAVLWASLPLTLLRGLATMNLAVHRGGLNVGRHNLVECTQSIAGVVLAFLLATAADLGAVGLVVGLAAGSLLGVLVDAPLIARHVGPPDRAILRAMAQFAAPLVLSFALAATVAYADRLFLEQLAGSSAVGIYAVASGIVDRPIMLVFVAVTLAAYPLAVDKLEREGAAAAREQLLRNVTVLLALAVPAVVGIACIAQPLASVVVGADYRDGVADILPWFAALAFLRGVTSHYLDHAIHLAKRTALFGWTLGPAAATSLILNPLLIPRFGLAGSLAATLAAQTLALVLTAAISCRVFPLGFPLSQTARIAVAAAIMGAALVTAPLPAGSAGLAAAVVLGACTYGAAAGILDVAGVGAAVAGLLRSRFAQPLPTFTAIGFRSTRN